MSLRKNIKIGLIGFNRYRHYENIKYQLEKNNDSRFRIQVLETTSDLNIVDADTDEGRHFLNRNKPGPNIYGVSTNPPENNRFFINKPLNSSDLKQLLDDYLGTLNTVDTNKSPKKISDGNNKKPASSNFYQPDNYLLGRLLDALSKKKSSDDCIQINLPLSQTQLMMIIFCQDQRVYISGDVDNLDKFYRFMFGQIQINTQRVQLNKEEKQKKLQSACMSLEKLIWDAAIGASLGRLPQGSDEHATMKLKYWPNFTRLKLCTGYLQIASLWSQNGLSIKQVRNHLPQYAREINAFYSAAQSLHLFEMTAYELKADSSNKLDKGLFNKLFKWIRS